MASTTTKKAEKTSSREDVPDSNQKVKWDAMFDQLKEYKEKHGDCLVPQRYQENPKLGRWVNKQRENRERLPQDRKELLESIGFVWSVVKREPWEVMFQRLVDYREKNGDCLVPQRYELDPRLGGWVREQRKRKDNLIKERRECLDAIGFAWRVKDHHAQQSQRAAQNPFDATNALRGPLSQSAALRQRRAALLRSEMMAARGPSFGGPTFVNLGRTPSNTVDPHLRASIFSDSAATGPASAHMPQYLTDPSTGRRLSDQQMGMGMSPFHLRGSAAGAPLPQLPPSEQSLLDAQRARRASLAALYPLSPESKADDINLDVLIAMRMRRERLLAEYARGGGGGGNGAGGHHQHHQQLPEEQKTSELAGAGSMAAAGMPPAPGLAHQATGQQPSQRPSDYSSLAAFRRANPDYPYYPWAA